MISETSHPVSHYNTGHYNWGMQPQYWQYHSQLMNMNKSYQHLPAVSPVPELENSLTGHTSINRPMQSQLQLCNFVTMYSFIAFNL